MKKQTSGTSSSEVSKQLRGSSVQNSSIIYGNKNIKPALLTAVKSTVHKIDKILGNEVKTSIHLGEALHSLEMEFIQYFTQGKEDKLKLGKAKKAFRDFIQHRFKLGESSANEYMKVAGRKDIRKLKLPICALIEISRLEPEGVKKLLEVYPVRELKELPFKDIKKYVRELNPNVRKKLGSKAVANRLKSTFVIVKEEFAKTPAIEQDIANVLNEITSWYQQNIPSAKKAA